MKNVLTTLTGPSCSGKTTLINTLCAKHNFKPIVSHTTRPPRPGEINGVDYHFVESEEFNQKLKLNHFIESIKFNGYQYGVSNSEIRAAFTDGLNPVLIVEPNGLSQIIKYYSNSTTKLFKIYIDGSLETLITRYLRRMGNAGNFDKQTLTNHSKRIISLFHEHASWKSNNYDMYINHMDEDNFKTQLDAICMALNTMKDQ